ncbi:MAG: methyltransferase domain-containing protein [Bryobacterales bacterium]|nr:methyltransferase domain-containing protein [Bryobacterales bacterium]
MNTNAMTWYDSSGNTVLLRYVPPKSRVLDIGCATGRRGAWLREHLGCRVVGVEFNPEMAEIARSRCDGVHLANLEELPELPEADASFDVLIFGDVLEHLRNPEQVLRYLQRYLSRDGRVLISLPNFLFLFVRIKVVLGLFRYTEYGILDKTHLRFFTKDTAGELVRDCGLTVLAWDYMPPEYGPWRVFPSPVRRMLAHGWPSLFAFQFVLNCARNADDESRAESGGRNA